MILIQNILAIFLIVCGTLFILIGSIGINRLPDFYTRTHASGKVDVLGIMMFLSGLAVFEGFSLNAAKLLLIVVFVLVTSPVASHQLSRRALYYGLTPWFRHESKAQNIKNDSKNDKKEQKEQK
jgi:multicomponent Na+:H+ antiporter subunit G